MTNERLMAFCAAGEQISNAGEDCFTYSVSSNFGYIAVFDGCGGMGAKKYPQLGNQTGARIASLLAGYVTNNFFEKGLFKCDSDDTYFLKEHYLKALKAAKILLSSDRGIKIAGKMYKEMPTTAVVAFLDCRDGRKNKCEFIWAGDSRGYYLDTKGICQVTKDDIFTNDDAFENLRNDGVLSNIINADEDFILHRKVIEFNNPMLIIVSTDGGFGYLTTPMEFEYLILDSLFKSESVDAWEAGIAEYISQVAGDDYSVGVISCGFETISECKSHFKKRYLFMSKLITKLHGASEIELNKIWNVYKTNYYRR